MRFSLLRHPFPLQFQEKTCIFAREFRRHSGGVRKDFIEKGVIEIIFRTQTSQLWNDTKMIAVAPHRWYVQPQLATYITFGVGYCFIYSKGEQCEEA